MEHNAGTASRELSDAIAVEIQVHLLRREMTQADLAERMGVSEMWISRRLKLRGQRQEISVNELARFADALEVGLVDLLPQSARKGSMSTTTSLTRRIRAGAVRIIVPSADQHLTGRATPPNVRAASNKLGRPADDRRPAVNKSAHPADDRRRLARLPR